MNKNKPVRIICNSADKEEAALRCADALGVEVNGADPSAAYTLVFSANEVYLDSPTSGRIKVDFCEGKVAHRRKFGGGKGQLVAKAVGLNHGFIPSVFDATAGLGVDGFVLASLGCKVTLAERSPIAYALLGDGLARAQEFGQEQDAELLSVVERMKLIGIDSLDFLKAGASAVADVVYLDPMFPPRTKSAAVKKGMQAFHDLIGEDNDSEELLQLALEKAVYRVVVKRPRLAGTLAAKMPGFSFAGKTSRYDIYVLKGIVKRSEIDSKNSTVSPFG